MNYLAFDLGASSGKLFLCRYDGAHVELEAIHRFENMAIPLKDGLYWDFLNIWRNMCVGIQKAGHCTGEGIQSFGIDSYCNDFSFIDKSGELLSPIRCYRDGRTIRCSDAIYQKMSPWELYLESGNQIASFNTLMQLAAMRHEKKDAVIDNASNLVFLPDLLAYYMTGEIVAERTVSSVSQMYSFYSETWSKKILEIYDIPERLFGKLTSPGSITGRASGQFRKDWGVGDFDFVSVCEHDTASAFIAPPHIGDSAIISGGTWALVGCEVSEPIINDYGFKHNIANEGSMPGHHRLVRNVMGLWLLQELRADLLRDGVDLDYSNLEIMASGEKPFNFLVDVDDPCFFTPGDIRKKIREQGLEKHGNSPETPGQFARCIYDSLVLKYRWAIERLEYLTGRELPMISIIGGSCKDKLICRLTACACGRPVMSGPVNASAMGNIIVQMIAQGDIEDIPQGRELLAANCHIEEYLPEDTERWNDIYMEYKTFFGLED